MQDVMQPVIDLEKQLESARSRAVETLLAERGKLDEKLERLGHSMKKKRGRPAAQPAK